MAREDGNTSKQSRMGVPSASSAAVRQRMVVTARRNTAPEIAIRKALEPFGLAFSVDRSPLVGLRRRADLLFEPEQIAVFVDGCFWHACPIHGTWPKANGEWWREKIEANRRRDADTNRQLLEAGWAVLRIWEHENPNSAAELIVKLLDNQRLRQVAPDAQSPESRDTHHPSHETLNKSGAAHST